MIPHITRALVGPQFRKIMPVSAMLGGVFVLIMDDIVRSLFNCGNPNRTSYIFLGAPFFYMLIKEGKKS